MDIIIKIDDTKIANARLLWKKIRKENEGKDDAVVDEDMKTFLTDCLKKLLSEGEKIKNQQNISLTPKEDLI